MQPNILKYINIEELTNSKIFSKEQIKHLDVELINETTIINYYKMFYYSQEIVVSNHEIASLSCNCYEFFRKKSCIHIASILNNYYNEIVNSDINSVKREISANIMNNILNLNNKTIKKEAYLEIDIKYEKGEKYLNLKVGESKFYIIRPKARSFFNCYYNNNGEVTFGKNFIYDASYYFNPYHQKIIDFAYDVYLSHSNNYEFLLDDYKFKQLISLADKFTINGNNINITEKFNYNIILTKNDNDYIFNIDIDINKVKPLTNDFEYILVHNNLIKLNKEYALLIKNLYNNNTNTVLFQENDIKVFSETILPIVKEEIEITEKIDNIVIVKKPTAKIYLDINYSYIIAKLEFKYKNEIINYFDREFNIVLRDHNYEDEVKDTLLKEGFIINKNKFILNDDDLIGTFLDERINLLNNEYEVYTSEKIKSLNILKNNHVKSTFSIGTDNIMKFSFEVDNVENKEIKNILNSLKKKKKYYKLSNGDYLNLENEDLKEILNIKNDLDINELDFIDNSIAIPKYRAIYLDSLKKDKYKTINTNNLFEAFINNFYKYKDIDVKFDKKEKSILRDYQSLGIKWLYNLYKCDLGGILADEMGLGKSIQTLYFVRRILKEDKNAKILIATPTSLCYNWEKEIIKFTPEIKYHIFCENRNIRRKIIKNNNINVYITSYGLLREDIELYKEKEFNIFVIDEAQNIKNPYTGVTNSVKEIKSKFRLALTGTPIENSLLELWSLFDFIMPGFFGTIKEFNNKYKINSIEEDKEILRYLNKQISPFILRRKKKDVILDLPNKIENNIYIELNEFEKNIYSELVSKTKKEIDEIVASDGFLKSRFKILELLTRLRQVCIHPKIIFDEYDECSSKINEVINVITNLKENGHKALLFSSFRTALSLVEEELKKSKISYYLIDGSISSKKRLELVDKFNTDDTTVFLIMLKAGGTGLNLASADTVIHLDLWWNPQAENQATDRAHRIGQKQKVSVIKLITKGTIEERILELQEKKKLLSENVIEGNNRNENIISTLTEKDIRKLLEG